MEFLFRNAYTLVVLVPALLIGPGCGGDPPKPPPGAPTEPVEDLDIDVDVNGPSLGTPSNKEGDQQDAGTSSDKNPE